MGVLMKSAKTRRLLPDGPKGRFIISMRGTVWSLLLATSGTVALEQMMGPEVLDADAVASGLDRMASLAHL